MALAVFSSSSIGRYSTGMTTLSRKTAAGPLGPPPLVATTPTAYPGFTLIEVVIVLCIIAIVSTFALPRLGLSSYRVDSAMRLAQANLQQAERLAVQRQSDVMVSFDLINNRIRVLNDLNDNHVVDAGEDVRWRTLEDGTHFAVPPTGVNGTVARAVTGANLSLSTDGYPTVYYRRDGASSTAYEMYMQSSSGDPNDFRALIVNQATGRVELYKYVGATWRQAGF